MKIELTKEEWEFLHLACIWHHDKNHMQMLNNLLNKLGSEWVDDE